MVEWNQILLDEKYSPEQPDELIVDFFDLLRKVKERRVIDLGCGAGRHVVYMAEHGFETHGLDISGTGLKLTKERLRERNLEAHLVKCDMESLPYINSCFNTIISLNTIYHQKLKGIQETIKEIHRVLKQKGQVLTNFHSKRSSKYGKGARIEENTFAQRNGLEKGILHHFVDEKELEWLFKNFRIVNKKLIEQKSNGYLRSLWIIVAEKSQNT